MGDVLGWLWFLIPLGIGVLALREYRFAKLCFTVSGLLLASKVVMELHNIHNSLPAKLLLAFIVCGIVGATLVYSWSWVDRKEKEDHTPPASVQKLPKEIKTSPELKPELPRPQPPEPQAQPKALLATVKSEIVSRIYSRISAPVPPVTTTEATFQSQELFYEWSLFFMPKQETGTIQIKVRDSAKHNESLRIEPDIASVAQEQPGWMSGFTEPSRKPDYYETRIIFPSLDANRPAMILFRRALKVVDGRIVINSEDFDRTFDITAEKCPVEVKSSDRNAEIATLRRQLVTIANWRWSGKESSPLPIRKDPNEPLPPLARGEVEATLEARCQDELCQKLEVKQLEVRRNP